MATVRVDHLRGDRFRITTRGHTQQVDQPLDAGGEDTAPTPTELFVGSLTSCVAFYVRRYLTRHDLPTAGLAVTCEYAMASRPARVSDIRICVELPTGVPADRRDALLAVASHCTVHNTLADPPAVAIGLVDRRAAA